VPSLGEVKALLREAKSDKVRRRLSEPIAAQVKSMAKSAAQAR
jgi:hypothetical protein